MRKQVKFILKDKYVKRTYVYFGRWINSLADSKVRSKKTPAKNVRKLARSLLYMYLILHLYAFRAPLPAARASGCPPNIIPTLAPHVHTLARAFFPPKKTRKLRRSFLHQDNLATGSETV